MKRTSLVPLILCLGCEPGSDLRTTQSAANPLTLKYEDCFPEGTGVSFPGSIINVYAADTPKPYPQNSHPSINDALAAADLQPGDQLRLLPGTHLINGAQVLFENLQGTAAHPIRIKGAQGAVITSAHPDFKSMGAWSPDFQGAARVYRSAPIHEIWGVDEVAIYAKAMHGFFIDAKGDHQQLVRYLDEQELRSEETYLVSVDGVRADVPYYVGPGLFLNYDACASFLSDTFGTNAPANYLQNRTASDCRLRIRLEPTPTQSMFGRQAPSNNPNNLPLEIFMFEGIRIRDSAHLKFENLVIEGLRGIDLERSKFIDFKNVDARIARSLWIESALSGNPKTHHVKVMRSKFDSGFPEYLYWGDLKTYYTPAAGVVNRLANEGPAAAFHVPLIQIGGARSSNAVVPYCVTVEDNRLEDGWWGVYATAAQKVFINHNRIRRMHEEGVTFYSKFTSNIEIAHNKIFDSRVGVVQSPSGPPNLANHNGTEGRIYIHHNAIDQSRSAVVNGARRFAIGFLRPSKAEGVGDPMNPFGFLANPAIELDHGPDDLASTMHIYNNTIRVDGAGAYPGDIHRAPRSYFVNNIVIQRDTEKFVASQFRLGQKFANGKGVLANGEWYWRTGDGPGIPALDDPSFDCSTHERSEGETLLGDIWYEDHPEEPTFVYATRNGMAYIQTAPVHQRMYYRGLANFWCATPAKMHYRRSTPSSSVWSEILQFDEVQSLSDPNCPGCGTFMASTVYAKPTLDSAYRPASVRTSAVTLPDHFPEQDNTDFRGACQTQACDDLGPRN